MKKVYTSQQMREREQAAVDAGTSFDALMENAGTMATRSLLRRFTEPRSCLIVCGRGNNAGDGLVMARLLAQKDWDVYVSFVLPGKLSELAQTNLDRLDGLNIKFIELNDVPLLHTDIIIDAIFGTGFSGQLPLSIAVLLKVLNRHVAYRVALDIPTGLNGDTGEADISTFCADLTYAFAAYKPAHIMPQNAIYCGTVVRLNIGIK